MPRTRRWPRKHSAHVDRNLKTDTLTGELWQQSDNVEMNWFFDIICPYGYLLVSLKLHLRLYFMANMTKLTWASEMWIHVIQIFTKFGGWIVLLTKPWLPLTDSYVPLTELSLLSNATTNSWHCPQRCTRTLPGKWIITTNSTWWRCTVDLVLRMTQPFKRELRAIKLAKPMLVQDVQIRIYAQRHRRDQIQISLISQSEWLPSNTKS